MKTILKPAALKADPDKILGDAIQHPQYVDCQGVLLVITKADAMAGEDQLLSSWEQRAKTLENFYDPAKAW